MSTLEPIKRITCIRVGATISIDMPFDGIIASHHIVESCQSTYNNALEIGLTTTHTHTNTYTYLALKINSKCVVVMRPWPHALTENLNLSKIQLTVNVNAKTMLSLVCTGGPKVEEKRKPSFNIY